MDVKMTCLGDKQLEISCLGTSTKSYFGISPMYFPLNVSNFIPYREIISEHLFAYFGDLT